MSEYPVRIVYVQAQNEAAKRAAKKYFQTHKEQIYAKRKEWRAQNEEYRKYATESKRQWRARQADIQLLMNIDPSIFS